MKNAVLTMKEFPAQFLVLIYELYSFIVHGYVKRRRVQHVLSPQKRDFVLYYVIVRYCFPSFKGNVSIFEEEDEG